MAGLPERPQHAAMNATKALRPARWPLILGGVVGALLLAVLICEALGWPFLAGPLQRIASQALDRKVLLAPDGSAPSGVRIGLLGSVRLDAPYLEIAAPSWSRAPHMLLVRDAELRLGYLDLWRAYKGAALHIRELQASTIDGQLERSADGRASWQFGDKPPSTSPSEPAKIPTFGRLQVTDGTLVYRDAPLTMDLDAKFSLLEQQRRDGTAPGGDAASAPSAAVSGVPPGLQFHGTGSYLKLPFRVDLGTNGVTSIVGENAAKIALPVSLDAEVGQARMTFRGTATDPVHFGDLKGRFSVKGPSLAAMGDPLKLTLPTTGPFVAEGAVAKTGVVWNAVLEGMSVGSSRLNGAFTFDPRPATPILSGRLNGSRLALADLGPTIGAPPPKAGPSPETVKAPPKKDGKVLPDRAFDLPSLRAMNANVLIDVADVDLGSKLLEPMRPLRGHLVLDGGVLSITDLLARTGQGSLAGSLRLDGRNDEAIWNADLRLDNVKLSTWIRQSRGPDQPPYLSGDLDARVRIEGQGKSTAAILGSLKGGMRFNVSDGSISHLALEAAGLDLAQALGVFVKSDDAMPMRCAVADLLADHGTLKPRVMVVDTADSVLWVDGSMSLATEALDMKLLVSPKDFSPLALRTPVRLAGTFGDPSVSLEYGKLGGRVGAAALLAFVTPIAAVIPFFDTGSSDDAKRGAASCQALLKRIALQPQLSAPGTPSPISAPPQAQRQGIAPATARPSPLPAGKPEPVAKLGPPSTR